jgi:hypothetical protein
MAAVLGIALHEFTIQLLNPVEKTLFRRWRRVHFSIFISRHVCLASWLGSLKHSTPCGELRCSTP